MIDLEEQGAIVQDPYEFMDEICRKYGITREAFLSVSRQRRLMLARKEYARSLRAITINGTRVFSYHDIRSLMNYKCHTSVLNLLRRADYEKVT